MGNIISIEISFDPTIKQFNEIEKWLRDEDKKSDEGFYCNLHFIQKSFNQNEMAVISLDKKVIGFVTWYYPSEHSARIYFAEIKPSNRKQGYGKILIEQLFNKFVEKHIFVVDLECSPDTSEKYWRKLKFIDFPKNVINDSENKQLFRILIPNLKQSKINKKGDEIQLWNNNTYLINNIPANWCWKVRYKKNSIHLSKPIVFPCHYDWIIRWSNKGERLQECKAKNFYPQSVMFDKYLIITELANLKSVT